MQLRRASQLTHHREAHQEEYREEWEKWGEEEGDGSAPSWAEGLHTEIAPVEEAVVSSGEGDAFRSRISGDESREQEPENSGKEKASAWLNTSQAVQRSSIAFTLTTSGGLMIL